MITSKLAGHGRTTIPKQVLEVLDLREGDRIAYGIEDGQVALTRAPSDISGEPFRHFGEWNSEADRQAYRSL
ncbi:transcriptional regulator [Azospirillum sp. SYSU D00513]|uniref:transcriptional regulator n=1 Tax=Azospirillum sp. SYSU D00513 TaxID=2812561 RepID=UPI001A966DEE|nr:transcriptional regulator [Azospirillum sp. SYSU D00513]